MGKLPKMLAWEPGDRLEIREELSLLEDLLRLHGASKLLQNKVYAALLVDQFLLTLAAQRSVQSNANSLPGAYCWA